MHPFRQAIWGHIWQHTVEKSQTSTVNVNFDPVLQTLWRPISKYTVEKSQTNATNVILYRLVREEICGDISKTHTVENKKYEYAKSYSNHDEIVEILSVEINSKNHDKNDDEDDDDDDDDDDEYNNAGDSEYWQSPHMGL